MALSLALLDGTGRITVGTGIAAGIYLRHSHTMATGASLIEELHPGRFLLGVGVSHMPFHEEMGISPGKSLADMRQYVENIRSVTEGMPCPPIMVAALRKKMTALAGQIAESMVADVALFGTPSEVRERAEAWADVGVTHLVLDTVSAVGDSFMAPYEVIAAFD